MFRLLLSNGLIRGIPVTIQLKRIFLQEIFQTLNV
jgi:hypothetical protein